MAGSGKVGGLTFQKDGLVTKRNIVQTIAKQSGLQQLQAKQIVQKTFDAIVTAIVEDGRVELRNFGVFEVRWRKPRKARNPRTGEKVFVPARCIVTFKPGQAIKERVDPQSRKGRNLDGSRVV
jgi:integration host factor subunit beta